MKWHKLGLLFSPSGQFPWMRTHASLPVPLRLAGDVYRVYFASRDEQNRSHVGFVEFDIRVPKDILRVSTRPVLAPGALGYFDDHGVYASSIVEYEQNFFMYYVGWNPGVKKPLFYASIGLAVSKDMGITFSKIGHTPIMARSEFDPCLVTAPCVMIDSGIWRMWYVSGFKWEELNGQLYSYYHIKYAESKDGMRWERDGLVCIDLDEGETNIARPCVLKEGGVYKMWYSYNSRCGYRIGYAESSNGYTWTRMDDKAGIDVSREGWDSKAVAYPWVFSHEGRMYMLYNGNEFGKKGYGLAELVATNSRI